MFEQLTVIYGNLSEKSCQIIPALIAGYFLLKLLIFAAKLAFTPCGVNVFWSRFNLLLHVFNCSGTSWWDVNLWVPAKSLLPIGLPLAVPPMELEKNLLCSWQRRVLMFF
jgi:hypothetical protein